MIDKAFRRIRYVFFPTEHQRVLGKWYRDGGDYKLRFNYDLTAGSLVLDIGGYHGQWTSDIFARYCCRVFVFEPVRAFAESIRERFKGNQNIEVLPFGVGGTSRTESIAVCRDGSSIFRSSCEREEIRIIDIADWLRSNAVATIDLMKINIEGGEYELLERLIETGLIRGVRNVQVQFHAIVKNADARMKQIQDRLRETHNLTYQYRFVWENWALKTT